ncbi:hypothetical protein, variant [Aphanomyces invadans]|uniref:Mitochondrial carrier protein n=1 Tax=Aphanomyces invadans TaxID=157072 RepID=A0A024U3W5_9STRA|nr:hypothetical protein, variant [Aphanomyces invadans]ETW01121.1 hypothetical protein, variant [Aphanomyces invadans]|eukprot:XP_008870119.1 hypothetical protein, variant [Aphanomyces invadans]
MEDEAGPVILSKVQTVITHFFSGTVAGVTGAVAGYPLDTIKSRMQTQMHLPSAGATGRRVTPVQALVHSIRQEGFLSLYRGASTQVARQAIGCSMLFGLMAQFKWLFYTPSAGAGSPEAHPQAVLTASAACTGVVEASIYCPFEITMIRMQTQAITNQTTPQCAAQIFSQYGVRNGLYRGFVPTGCREVVGNTIYFLTYDRIKELLQAKTTMSPMQVHDQVGRPGRRSRPSPSTVPRDVGLRGQAFPRRRGRSVLPWPHAVPRPRDADQWHPVHVVREKCRVAHAAVAPSQRVRSRRYTISHFGNARHDASDL